MWVISNNFLACYLIDNSTNDIIMVIVIICVCFGLKNGLMILMINPCDDKNVKWKIFAGEMFIRIEPASNM